MASLFCLLVLSTQDFISLYHFFLNVVWVYVAEVADNENVRRTEKKIREDWISSAAIWGLFIQTVKKESGTRILGEHRGANVSQVLKSKRVLQKTKQLLFDCVRELATNFPGKDNEEQTYKQFLGPHELGKLVSKRTKEWSVVTRDGRSQAYLFSLDELNSMYEWNELELHVKDIALEIADAIWECINDEIVSEFIEYLPVT